MRRKKKQSTFLAQNPSWFTNHLQSNLNSWLLHWYNVRLWVFEEAEKLMGKNNNNFYIYFDQVHKIIAQIFKY